MKNPAWVMCLTLYACKPADAPPPAPPSSVAATSSAAAQVVRINVTDMGYEPAQVELKAGILAELVFNQQSKMACVAQVQAPDFNIPVTNLPFGQSTTLRFTPARGGTFRWACGMDMMKGTILVKN